eukprot:2775426-Rhodomonas_salina.1
MAMPHHQWRRVEDLDAAAGHLGVVVLPHARRRVDLAVVRSAHASAGHRLVQSEVAAGQHQSGH